MGRRTRSILRKLAIGAAGLAILLAVAAAGGWLWLRTGLPQTEGTIALAGLRAPVTILRDRHGIPTIRAGNEHDAFFALGFVHAQDRLWQMDFLRRVASGRLSEILGPRTLEIDRLMRGLGLARVAAANLAIMRPDMRAVLDAYAAGVNAYIAGHRGAWPPEFLLLGYRPEPWRAEDTVLWGRLMALQLSGNYPEELSRARIALALPPELLHRLFPPGPDDGPVTVGAADAIRLAAALPTLDQVPGLGSGASNAWALAGSATQSGKPLLANDPHLGFAVPILWYLARIETPDLMLAGATVPGVPAMLIGHNGHIAWGFTTTQSDTQDLFIEQVVDADHYAAPGGPLKFGRRSERIAVAGAAPVELTVRLTRHGPVLSDLSTAAAEAAAPGYALALAWPGLAEDDRTAEAMLRLNRARGWQEFQNALRDFDSPQQNIFYADRDGNIGMIAPARVPIRAAGDGRLPVPGWSGAFDWTGYIPFERLPRTFDPPSGRIVNANNRIVPDSYPFLISAEWEWPYRALRINQALDQGASRTPEAAGSLQLDTLSLAARDLLPFMLNFTPANQRQTAAVARLKAWDGRMDRGAGEPLLFAAWLLDLTHGIFADELGPAMAEFGGWQAERVRRVLADDRIWCDDIGTPEGESCADILAATLDQALDQLTTRLGPDMAAWRWGSLHQVRFAHPVFTYSPILRRIFDRTLPVDGDFYTLNRAAPRSRGPDLFEAFHGAGLRAVFDLADLDRSHFIIATGQSGHILSPHYDDLLSEWRDGGFVTIVGDEGAQRLVLTPR
jgi:penicillin G amidase